MDTQLISKLAESSLGWAVAVYLFIMLIKEKDKRIEEANAIKNQYGRLLSDIRRFVNAINKKADNG